MELPKLKQAILNGDIFIYPTDTIYGLGCNAENKEAVARIKAIKKREKHKPLSIIAPSKAWIKTHCFDHSHSITKYLPGPYTLVLEKKDHSFLHHVSSKTTLGVRIPGNDFCKLIQEIGKPFITTSVNLAGKPFAKKISEISESILDKADHVIDVGELSGEPSTIIIEGKEVKGN